MSTSSVDASRLAASVSVARHARPAGGSPAPVVSSLLLWRGHMARWMLAIQLAFCLNLFTPTLHTEIGLPTTSDGNLVNQLFWLLMVLVAVLMQVRHFEGLRPFYARTSPIWLLCGLLFLSAVWSLAPSITLRRAGLETIVIWAMFSCVAMLPRPEDAFVIFYRISVAILCVDWLMALAGMGWDEIGLRGMHPHKNVLGYVAALSLLVGGWLRLAGRIRFRFLNLLFLLGWLGLLLLSQSKTSLGLTIAAPLLAWMLRSVARFFRVGLAFPVAVLAGLLYVVLSLIYIAGVDVVSAVEHWVGSVGFTGRDNIWGFLLARVSERPWLGHGYGGFWDIGAASPAVKLGTGFIPNLNQAHNGYLELALALGALGGLAVTLVLARYLLVLSRVDRRGDADCSGLCWALLVFVLMHNFTESTLLRGYNALWMVLLMSMAVIWSRSVKPGTQP